MVASCSFDTRMSKSLFQRRKKKKATKETPCQNTFETQLKGSLYYSYAHKCMCFGELINVYSIPQEQCNSLSHCQVYNLRFTSEGQGMLPCDDMVKTAAIQFSVQHLTPIFLCRFINDSHVGVYSMYCRL